MKENKIRNILEHFWTPFLVVSFVLFLLIISDNTIISSYGLLHLLIGALIVLIGWGLISLLFNKLIRPKFVSHFVNHKNLKALESYGLHYDEEYYSYDGIYRKFEVSIGYVFDDFELTTAYYAVNVIFNKESAKSIKQVRESKDFKDKNIKVYAHERLLKFNFFPPKTEKIIAILDDIIDLLIENKVEPIELNEIN